MLFLYVHLVFPCLGQTEEEIMGGRERERNTEKERERESERKRERQRDRDREREGYI